MTPGQIKGGTNRVIIPAGPFGKRRQFTYTAYRCPLKPVVQLVTPPILECQSPGYSAQ
ncbi:MAG: hypothetical protein ACXWQZ_13865 [Ktedonobacterales bacterium]